MSVVNRMLQDIDRRMGPTGVAAQHPDIRSVVAAPREPSSPKSGRVVLGVAVVAALAGGAWHLWQGRAAAPPAAAPVAKAPAAIPAAPQAPAEPAARFVPVSASLLEPVPAAESAPAEPALVARPRIVAARPRAEPETRAVAGAVGPSLRLSEMVAAPPPLAIPAAERRLKAEAPLKHVAEEETVAAARALWNSGARASALATLREALNAAEGARDHAAARTLGREIARLEVAGNRPQAALDLLRRLQEVFADDAEAWALRGNTEQRVSLHADAAQSYLTALRLKPGEGRWMLGAAISLAANGNTDEARSWVEQARERGAITPAIAGYLQQIGLGK